MHICCILCFLCACFNSFFLLTFFLLDFFKGHHYSVTSTQYPFSFKSCLMCFIIDVGFWLYFFLLLSLSLLLLLLLLYYLHSLQGILFYLLVLLLLFRILHSYRGQLKMTAEMFYTDGGVIAIVWKYEFWTSKSPNPFDLQSWNSAYICVSKWWATLPQEPMIWKP